MTLSRSLIRAALVGLVLLAPRPSLAEAGAAIGTDTLGRIYFVDTYRDVLWRVDRDGRLTALLRGVNANAMAVMPDGTVYLPVDDFTDVLRWRITIVAPSGAVRDTTIATAIAVEGGHSVGADTAGIYFQRGHEMSQVSFTGVVSARLYALPPNVILSAVAPTVMQRLAVLDGNMILRSEYQKLGPDTVGSRAAGFADMGRTSVRFDHPMSLSVDDRGTMYLVDYGNRRVRRITYGGTASTLAHPAWPWRPTALALRGDTVYVLELAPVPSWLAGVAGTPRVERILPSGTVEVVVALGNWTGRILLVVGVALAAGIAMLARKRSK